MMKRFLFSIALLVLACSGARAHMISPVPYPGISNLHEAALLRGGVAIAPDPNPNACGVSANTWCVGSDGWTLFSGTPTGTGTACGPASATTTRTCIVAASNTVASSFTAHTSGTTALTIDSGTAPSVGQTVIRTSGTVLGTIVGVVTPGVTYTMSGSSTVATEAMTSSAGNDTTCAAQAMPALLTSAALSSFTPALPCLTVSKAQSLMRDAKPDWLVLKKGDEWCGGWNGSTGGIQQSGKSLSEPQVFASYGVGARPKLKACGQNVSCAEATSTRGRYTAMIGIECYVEYMDPASPNFLGVTVNATATAGSAVLTGVTNVSGDYANLTTAYRAYGSGIVNNLVTSVNTGAGTATLTSNASFSGTMQVQFVKSNNSTGLAITSTATLFILEDCYFNYTTFAFAPVPPSQSTDTNLRVRRNVVANSYSATGAGGSPFIGDIYQGPIIVEENFSYHVGWNETVWSGSGFNQVHGWYIHDPNRGTVFTRNMTALSSGNAGQIRNGGTLYDNLSINNPLGFNQAPFGFTNPGGTLSYNTVTGSGETITGIRIATAATAVGNAVLHVPGVLNSGATTFAGRSVDNLDNPGSITGSLSSLGADTITMVSNISAGQRGNGVQIGDRIQVSVYGGQGDNTRATGALLLSTNPDNPGDTTTYPIGSSTFYAQASFPIAAWVVPGMRIQSFNDQTNTGFPGGVTTVATIAADRLSLTTSDVSTAVFRAFQIGANTFFYIFTPASDVSTYWPSNVLTKNIYANNLSKGKTGSTAFALNMTPGTQGASITNNYLYDWNPDPTLNVLDQSGYPGQNVISPQALNCGGTGGSSCSNAHPNLYVEAYEATLTTNNITASILSNGSGGTILRVTAGSVSVGQRVFGTGVIPALILSDFGGGDYLIDTAQVVGSRAMYTGSLANFFAVAKAQSKDNWDVRYTANAVNEFFRVQLGISSQPVTYH